MKLYTNDNGEWFGTQALAKQRSYHWWPVEVPTDKPGLLEYLNNRGKDTVEETTQPTTTHTSNDKKHPWQHVREMAEQASFRDLGVALAVVMNRLEEAAEKQET